MGAGCPQTVSTRIGDQLRRFRRCGCGRLGDDRWTRPAGQSPGADDRPLGAAEIVTADGRRHRVSAEKEPDLFWAIRGAGANFGIATAFEFEAAPIPVVAHASLVFVPSDLAGFLEQWGQTVEQAPHKISAFLYTMGRDFARATVVYAGEDEDAAAALEPFATLPGMSGAQAQMAPYPNVLTPSSAHTLVAVSQSTSIAKPRVGSQTQLKPSICCRFDQSVASSTASPQMQLPTLIDTRTSQ